MSYGIRISQKTSNGSLRVLFSTEDTGRFFPALIATFTIMAGSSGVYDIPRVYSAYPINNFFVSVVPQDGLDLPKITVINRKIHWDFSGQSFGSAIVMVFL